MHLSAEQVTIFLASLALLLFFARLFGEIFNKLKQASVIGEILAGIILGPTIFGALLPGLHEKLFITSPEIALAMDGLTTIAVVMLLIVSGMEVDLSVMLKKRATALWTSIMGMLLPFAAAFPAGYFLFFDAGTGKSGDRIAFSLFLGIALAISALPVIARTLMDLKILKTPTGQIIIASAIINDLVGWIGFSILLGMIGAGGHGLDPGIRVVVILIFTAGVLILLRPLINALVPFIQNRFTFPGGILNFIFILGFAAAAFTEWAGIHAIFGAFIIGIAIGDSAHIRERTRDMIHQFVTNLFAPLFFAGIGLRINFIEHFNPYLTFSVLAIALTGKIIGSFLGASMSGVKRDDSLIIGFGMSSQGAMGIILGLLALQFELINEDLFVALVIMSLVTSMASAPLIGFIMKRKRRDTLNDLIAEAEIIFTTETEKEAVIERLAKKIAARHGLNGESAAKAVIERERLVPTGLGNHVAVPHARLDIPYPVLGICLNRDGIDFNAPDEKKSVLIFLLMTPRKENELQLQFLADIAKKSRDAGKILELAGETSAEALAEKIREL